MNFYNCGILPDNLFINKCLCLFKQYSEMVFQFDLKYRTAELQCYLLRISRDIGDDNHYVV